MMENRKVTTRRTNDWNDAYCGKLVKCKNKTGLKQLKRNTRIIKVEGLNLQIVNTTRICFIDSKYLFGSCNAIYLMRYKASSNKSLNSVKINTSVLTTKSNIRTKVDIRVELNISS